MPDEHPAGEQTTWSPGLVGFYVSCGGVSISAAVAASGLLVLESTTTFAVGVVLVVAFSVSCFLSLRAARRG